VEPEEPRESDEGCSSMEQDGEPPEKQSKIKQEVTQPPSQSPSTQHHYKQQPAQDTHHSQPQQKQQPPAPQQSQASQQPPPESEFLLKPISVLCCWDNKGEDYVIVYSMILTNSF